MMVPFIQVCKYEDGSVSYWCVELSKEDDEKIAEILEPYIDCGFSVRGPRKTVLDELNNIIKEVPGWA